VYAPGKRPEEITAIVAAQLKCGSGPVLVTRLEPEVAAVIDTAGGMYDTQARPLT
jgi:NCAIR mutase (PurE)-related protein